MPVLVRIDARDASQRSYLGGASSLTDVLDADFRTLIHGLATVPVKFGIYSADISYREILDIQLELRLVLFWSRVSI
jgi:hypothetical protein